MPILQKKTKLLIAITVITSLVIVVTLVDALFLRLATKPWPLFAMMVSFYVTYVIVTFLIFLFIKRHFKRKITALLHFSASPSITSARLSSTQQRSEKAPKTSNSAADTVDSAMVHVASYSTPSVLPFLPFCFFSIDDRKILFFDCSLIF